MRRYPWLSLCSLLSLLTLCTSQLDELFKWGTLQWDTPFGYPTQNYDPLRTPPTSFDVSWDRVFLAVPRVFKGSPATLAQIPRRGSSSPILTAYPDWGFHADAAAGDPTIGNCTGLVSVFRMRIDKCDRLWVLDSGVLDTLETFTVACPPKILIFDLTTDTLVRSITFPSEVLRRNSLLTNLVLDEQSRDCSKTRVYLADSTAPGLVVYDADRDTTWRISHPYMFPDPDFGTYSVAGEKFTLMDGILGIALTGGRLYFHPFASDRLFSISTQALNGPNPGDDADLPVSLVGHKSSQAAGMAVGQVNGALYFSPVSETAVAAWTPGSPDHKVVAWDPERLQFVLDMRSSPRDGGAVWVLSTRFQKIMRRTLNAQEINFRLMRIQENGIRSNSSSLFLFRK